MGTTAERVKKSIAGSANSARVVRKKRTKDLADLKPQDMGARKSGKPRASSSLSHILSRKMTSWFLNRQDEATLAFYDISLLKQRDTSITSFSNPGYLRDEGATLIPQSLYLSVAGIHKFLSPPFPFSSPAPASNLNCGSTDNIP